MPFLKYNLEWPDGTDDVEIELAMVKHSGYFKGKGNGLNFHHERAQRLIWPELDQHRWSKVILKELTRPMHTVTCLMGCGSSGKSHEAAKWALIEYFADPQNTCVMVSSTDIRGLKLRIWGEITMLWQRAIDRWPNLAGHLLDSKIAITTDAIEDGDYGDRTVRDMRKAVCGIPCVQNNKFIGLSKFLGIKQKRVRLLGDELSLMSHQYIKAFSNLNNNEDFQAVVCFNPNDPVDPGGICAEPVDGWSGHMEPDKTTVWETKFMHGRCVNLVGTDSPNFDDPLQPNRYKYLIGPRKISDVVASFGKDSYEYFSQCVGVMKVGVMSRRVLTRDMCRTFRALEDVVWKDTNRTRIYAVDASYGGDRCVGGWAEFGLDADDKMVLKFHPPYIIPIRPGAEPEDQISTRVKADCDSLAIPPGNFFHDATGRGSLGTSLARIWSDQCVPLEFGGAASDRPVSMDHYIIDPDTRERRLQRCDEHYDRFVTELWFSVRYAVESEQVRNLPPEVMEELCMRTWELKKGNRKGVEPKSSSPGRPPGMKERTGRSPDMGDWSSIIVEGARQRGFTITKLGKIEDRVDESFFEAEAKQYEEALEESTLQHE